MGDIGLPDLQRPFVWTAAKVRDLFDSMYRCFPVGYLLFWSNSEIKGTPIGIDEKAHRIPHHLVVDGQQRLTSLFAVMKGRTVRDSDFVERTIEIALRPRDNHFEVADTAIRNDPEFIPNISVLWTSGKSPLGLMNDFLKTLESKKPLNEEDREAISHNLGRLFDLPKFPLSALEISPAVAEEEVADIFVRINSEGVQLKQADFILTLLSVFWPEGRDELERFAHGSRTPPAPSSEPSSFNYLIELAPDRLLRAVMAFGFQRARLRNAYMVLRGKDVDTGEFSPELRKIQFAQFREAQAQVLELKHWHLFLNCLKSAGFRSKDMISSEVAVLYSYVFYLVGRLKCGVDEPALERLISRWLLRSL